MVRIWWKGLLVVVDRVECERKIFHAYCLSSLLSFYGATSANLGPFKNAFLNVELKTRQISLKCTKI